jgi:hypothetical protein
VLRVVPQSHFEIVMKRGLSEFRGMLDKGFKKIKERKHFTRLYLGRSDPLAAQVDHFADARLPAADEKVFFQDAQLIRQRIVRRHSEFINEIVAHAALA